MIARIGFPAPTGAIEGAIGGSNAPIVVPSQPDVGVQRAVLYNAIPAGALGTPTVREKGAPDLCGRYLGDELGEVAIPRVSGGDEQNRDTTPTKVASRARGWPVQIWRPAGLLPEAFTSGMELKDGEVARVVGDDREPQSVLETLE